MQNTNLSRFLMVMFTMVALSGLQPTEALSVKVSVPNTTANVNGQIQNNKQCERPVIMYHQIPYLPLTEANLNHLGLKTCMYELYPKKKVLFIGTAPITADQYPPKVLKAAYKSSRNMVIPDITLALNTIDVHEFVENKTSKIPVLIDGGIIYLPITKSMVCDRFDWKYTYDTKVGLKIDCKNVNRPILNDSKIGDTSPMRGLDRMKYAFNKDAYAGFPQSTLDGFYEFSYKKRGEPEKIFSLESQLTSADYYFDENLDSYKGLPSTPSASPSLNGQVLTVTCVKNSNGKTVCIQIKIDMELQKVISEQEAGP